MQGELRSENPGKPIQFVGVNEVGHESGNSLMSENRALPVLQDVDADNNGSSDVWYDLWDVTYRDVKILDDENEIVGTVNLTPPGGFDLGDQANYDALKKIIADVANERPFWQNPSEPTDVNNDGRTSLVDAIQCINELSSGRVSGDTPNLPLPMPPLMPSPFLDVSGDGLITAIDALRVINRVANQTNSTPPEGEAVWQLDNPDALESESTNTETVADLPRHEITDQIIRSTTDNIDFSEYASLSRHQPTAESPEKAVWTEAVDQVLQANLDKAGVSPHSDQ